MMFILIFGLFLLGVNAKNWGTDPDCDGDEYQGVCVEPRYCFSTNPYIQGLKYPKECVTASGEAGVCCTDCELVYNATDAILDKRTTTGVLWKTGQKSWDKCIEYLQKYQYKDCYIRASMGREQTKDQCHTYKQYSFGGYVAGGTGAKRGEFPHMALLGYQDSTDPYTWLCSGALVSEKYILTAAHCVASRDLGPVTEAVFGILKRSDPAEQWQRYRIKQAIPHPGYNPPSKYHDIALLETEIPVKFVKELVLPACLPAYDDIDYNDKVYTVTATGWGGLGYLKSLADTLQKVSLKQFSAEVCDEQFPVHRHLRSGLDHSTQMCFGDDTAIKDTCKGDSGGPLQLDTHRPSCIFTLIGVTSYGSECGFLGQGGVYTKISPYLPWIEGIVWP